jgi:ribonuclease-3
MIDQLEKIIDYHFKDKQLLRRALTHPSLYKTNNFSLDYEVLEFLGDSVLNLIITEYLIGTHETEQEGELAKRRAALISGETLSTIAISLNLGMHIVMAGGEETSGGRSNPNNLEDALEAIIAAIYLDGGYEKAKFFVLKYWQPIIKNMKNVPTNPKTELQELSQKRAKGIPQYRVISSSGPPHLPKFEVEVAIEGEKSALGSGTSKKLAETQAAKLLLERLKTNG